MDGFKSSNIPFFYTNTESLTNYESNFPIFAAGKWNIHVYENDLKSNVAQFETLNDLPDVQFFLQN